MLFTLDTVQNTKLFISCSSVPPTLANTAEPVFHSSQHETASDACVKGAGWDDIAMKKVTDVIQDWASNAGMEFA